MLLFVFWYCHKRGKEVRLEKEKLEAGGGAADADASSISTMEESTTLDEEPGTTALRNNADAEKLQRILDASNPPKVALPPSDKKPGAT